jgi:hypothetical protein
MVMRQLIGLCLAAAVLFGVGCSGMVKQETSEFFRMPPQPKTLAEAAGTAPAEKAPTPPAR